MRIVDFISEDLRFDISWALDKSRQIPSPRPKTKIKRIERMEKAHTERHFSFINLLLKNEEKDRHIGSLVKGKEWPSSVMQATRDLKDFNYQKQREVYAFWKEYSDLWQAIFVIETILFNEVGRLDYKSGLEKRDITQVVINRLQITPVQYDSFR